MNQESIGAVVLAAGRSTRMGRLKPLLPFGNRPMLARVVETLQNAGAASPLIIVTGHAREKVEKALSEYSVTFAHNQNFASGEMLSSVQTGVLALPETISAFLIMPGDQPLVKTATVSTLIATWRQTRAPVVSPILNGKKGHPVLFDGRCRTEILALPHGATLRDAVRRHEAERVGVEVQDSGIGLDVDTPQDYERALALWQFD